MPAVCPETRRSSLASFSVHKAIKASSNPVINISSLKSTAATRASVAYIILGGKKISFGFRDPATIVPIRFEADIMDNFWTLAPKPLRKLSRLAPSFGIILACLETTAKFFFFF